jgi:hypothetical protein
VLNQSFGQVQQELLAARRDLETSRTQILSLEAALVARPALPVDAPGAEKDKLLAEQARTIRELEIVVHGYEENLGEPLRAVREDVEREWVNKLDVMTKAKEEKEAWAEVLVQQLEKEKRVCPWKVVPMWLILIAITIGEDSARRRAPSPGGVREQVRRSRTRRSPRRFYRGPILKASRPNAIGGWRTTHLRRTTTESGHLVDLTLTEY